MAKNELKEKAVNLRKKGLSYSQIKEKVPVSKGTLSLWLRKYPLSQERIRELRDWNEKRIENYRETMRQKREAKFLRAYKKISKDIGKLTDREIFLAGLFLYWGEGAKTLNSASISVSNTDPSMIKFFLKWVSILGIPLNKVNFKLQLYSNMNEEKEIKWWAKELSVKRSQFKRCYIKKSSTKDISYKREFTHGTCNAIIYGQKLNNYVLMGLKRIQEIS